MKRKSPLFLVLVAAFLLMPNWSSARWYPETKDKKDTLPGLQRVLVLDGSNVHNVGELQMHVGNWGNFGSWPGSANTFSEAPSAQWPAGSGVEYLFTAGLWIGALKGGIPAVSTAAYATEFRPTQDPIDLIYRTRGGRARRQPPAVARRRRRQGRTRRRGLAERPRRRLRRPDRRGLRRGLQADVQLLVHRRPAGRHSDLSRAQPARSLCPAGELPVGGGPVRRFRGDRVPHHEHRR